jgi:DNA repair protein RecO (recombination protein O)
MPSPDRITKLEAVVISHRDFGEADRFIRLFSRELGKMDAIAKGIRKARSRKAAHLEPFTHVALVLARGQSAWIITQADMLTAFNAIRDDLKKTAQAAYVVELADRLTAQDQVDSAVFRLVLETLKRLDQLADPFNALCHYELHLLNLTGFRPEFFKCVGCGREIQPQDQFFSARLGGVLCPQCGSGVEDFERLGLSALRYLRHFSRSAYTESARVNVPEPARKEMHHMISAHIRYMTEHRLNSPDFLNHLNHLETRVSPDGE